MAADCKPDRVKSCDRRSAPRLVRQNTVAGPWAVTAAAVIAVRSCDSTLPEVVRHLPTVAVGRLHLMPYRVVLVVAYELSTGPSSIVS